MSTTELSLAEAAKRSAETFRARETERILAKQYGEKTPWSEPRTFQEKPYLTTVTVAENRLSDLIAALQQLDPDAWVDSEEVFALNHPEGRRVEIRNREWRYAL